jgi:hypothetical protein
MLSDVCIGIDIRSDSDMIFKSEPICMTEAFGRGMVVLGSLFMITGITPIPTLLHSLYMDGGLDIPFAKLFVFGGIIIFVCGIGMVSSVWSFP